MDVYRDIQLLVVALRDRVIDPDRLAVAAADWTPGTGLIAHLAERGVISPDSLERLAAVTIDHRPEAVRDGNRSFEHTPRVGEGEGTTDLPAPDTPEGATTPELREPAGTGRYKVLRLHKAGGLGQVWLARDTAVGRDVALKTLRPERAAAESARSRFVREARVTGQLEHPSIVPLYDLAGNAADPFYVMRFISGRTLAEAAADYHKRRAAGTTGPLDLNTLLDAFINVCRAVAFAHSRNVLHRDLKGQNIVVGEYGETFLLDWGLAKPIGDPDQSAPTNVAGEDGSSDLTETAAVGTPAYMAPEVAAGGRATKSSDVYGLGAILYAVLAGRPPYTGSSGAEVMQKVALGEPAPVTDANPAAPPALVAVCRKAMARNPADRYTSAEEVATEVRRWLADEPVHAYREPLPARVSRWARRRKTAVVAAAVLLATGAVASTAAAGLIWKEQQETTRAWQKADEEKIKAAKNADAALEVVYDLSHYVELSEIGVGKPPPSDSDRWARLNSVLTSYVQLLDSLPENKFLRWHVARQHRMRANLSRFLNKNNEAEESYREAIRLLSQLAAEHPENSDYREIGALARMDYSQYLKRFGRHQESARIADETIVMFEDLLRAQPNESRYVRVVANQLVNRSDREYQVGRWVESEQSARRSSDLYARLAGMSDGTVQQLDPLFHAMADHNHALALREQDRIPEALDAHRRAVDRMALLIKVNKSRDALSFYHRIRTEQAWTQGRDSSRVAAAIADLESAIAGWDGLIKQLGETPVDLERKGVAGLYCGKLKMLAGQRDNAARDLSAAGNVLGGLVSKHPEIPAYRYSLGRVYTTLGSIAATPKESAELYRKAREMLEEATQRFPENIPYRLAIKELDALTAIKP